YKLGYSPHTEPARHRARNFVSDEVTKNRWMTRMFADRCPNRIANFVARFFLSQKLDVFRPRERDQHADTGGRAPIEKPPRRNVINTNKVQSHLTHQRKIGIRLFRLPEIISLRVR